MKKIFVVSICSVLTLSTLLVFWQVRNFGFVNYDDSDYVYENPQVLNGLTKDGVIWAFTTNRSANWHPLTWLSLMFDSQLFGANPGRMHLMNLILHLANTLLLFAVLRKMTGALWPSAFVAAAFAIHPMHVESVAWIAERKDVLSTLFLLLTLAAYVGYVRRPGLVRYVLTVLLFALGLLAKPMLVTLPFLLLLLDYWPLGRFDSHQAIKASSRQKRQSAPAYDKRRVLYRAIIEKIPFIALSVVSGVITFLVQRRGSAMVDINVLPFKYRAANAFLSYARYTGKMFWPQNLAPFYPFDADKFAFWQVAMCVLLLLVISIFVIRFGQNHKYLPVGWFWFVGTLVPVIGLVQVGLQSFADRYTYIPYIGLFIMLAWGLPELLSKWPQRKIALGLSMVIVLTALGICAHRQVGFWNNTLTLFSHAIKVTQNNYVAHNILGVACENIGRYKDAIDSCKQAIIIKPDYAEAHYNLGVACGDLGRWQDAADSYKQAIIFKPDYAKAHNNLGTSYEGLGRWQDAIEAYKQAIRIEPDYVKAYYNLGAAYGKLGRWQDAIETSKQAIKIKPDYAEAYNNLGNAYSNLGRYQEAAESYKQAIQINPDDVVAHCNLGVTYGKFGRWQDAIEACRQAIKIKPDYAEAYNNLGNVYSNLGRYQDAIEACRQAIKIKPDLAEAYINLGVTYYKLGRYQDAVEPYKQAIRLKPDFVLAHYNLGVACLVTGDKGSALEEYKILKTLDAEQANKLLNLINAK